MRRGFLLVALTVAGCTDPHALTYVDGRSAAIWNVNPSMWNADQNAVTTAPTLPAGVQPQAAR